MKKFKVVVAGCGSMSQVWIENALDREDTEIVGLVDIRKENAMSMLSRFGLKCEVFCDISEALRTTGANLVFDVTTPESHKNIVTTALEMGCDVFGEKPMASSMEEAHEMVRIANKTGKSYFVMQNRRYLRNIRALKSLLAAGTIGQPGFICADFFLGPHFGGFREIMDSPLILDMAIHTFDQARFIIGADPVSVYCHEFNPAGSWYRGNASAVCIFEFSDKSVFCYRGSWCAQGCNTSWESSWRITGSKGTAIWDGVNAPYCEALAPDQGNKISRIDAPVTWTGREGHYGCFDEMFSALLEGRKAETDCTDNIKSMAMVFGALKSAEEGRKVRI